MQSINASFFRKSSSDAPQGLILLDFTDFDEENTSLSKVIGYASDIHLEKFYQITNYGIIPIELSPYTYIIRKATGSDLLLSKDLCRQKE